MDDIKGKVYQIAFEVIMLGRGKSGAGYGDGSEKNRVKCVADVKDALKGFYSPEISGKFVEKISNAVWNGEM